MKNVYTILGIGSLAFITSCAPHYYATNTQNVPVFKEKGEGNLTVAGSGSQVEFQGAYAVTDAIALQANGALFIPQNLDNGNGGSGNFVEIGGGYYRPVGEKFVFESFGIVGYGSVENHFPSTLNEYPSTSGKISANAVRYGIQPAFGFRTTYFSAIISSRFVGLNYSNISGDLIYNNENQQAYLSNNNSHFIIEPALTIRGGFERVKLQLQYGHSLNITTTKFPQTPSYLTLGLNFRL